jgi:hypothetical protein
MNLTLHPGQAIGPNSQIRRWWFRNGILPEDSLGPIRVDTTRRTITYRRLVDDPEPGDLEFPELPRDATNRPLTEERELPLLVDPPASVTLRVPQSRVA